MEKQIKAQLISSIKEFKLPEYENIPDMGLYLEQTVRYVQDFLSPLPNIAITGSMVSNYVKKGLIANPVKKLYYREHIAYIIFIAVAKTVLSLEDIQLLIKLQKETYDEKTAYEYFCRELINIIQYVFGLKEELEEIGEKNSDEKTLLRNTVITVAHKIYLDMYFMKITEDM